MTEIKPSKDLRLRLNSILRNLLEKEKVIPTTIQLTGTVFAVHFLTDGWIFFTTMY